MLSVEEAQTSMQAWSKRIQPRTFRLLGGEPTLNLHLTEILYVARDNWPHSRLALTTNGFFLSRHRGLPRALHELNVDVTWTIHHRSPEYVQRAVEIRKIWDSWLRSGRFGFHVANASDYWTRRYHGRREEAMPFSDGDPRSSWHNCAAKYCRQLFEGKLWKCSPIAYLQLQKKTHPRLSAQWDRYLAYEALKPDCSQDELTAFVRREEEEICHMCPAHPKRFEKPSPLIPVCALRRGAAAN